MKSAKSGNACLVIIPEPGQQERPAGGFRADRLDMEGVKVRSRHQRTCPAILNHR